MHNAVVQSSSGSVSYKPEKSCLVWKIKQFQGGKEFIMRAHFGLPSVQAGEISRRIVFDVISNK